MLCDISSSYCEGHSCPLMRYGNSRDGKRGRPIVVYGVHGRPAGPPAGRSSLSRQHRRSGHGARLRPDPSRLPRPRLLEAAEQDLERIRREVARRTKKPLSATAIAEKVGRAKQRSKGAKHFQTQLADGSLQFCRDAHSVEREAALDGLYVIRAGQSDLAAEEVVRAQLLLCLLA